MPPRQRRRSLAWPGDVTVRFLSSADFGAKPADRKPGGHYEQSNVRRPRRLQNAGTVIVTGAMLGEKLSSSRLMVTAMAHGLAFGLLAFAMSGMSGGHLNPILTLAAVVSRRMPLARGVWYLVA